VSSSPSGDDVAAAAWFLLILLLVLWFPLRFLFVSYRVGPGGVDILVLGARLRRIPPQDITRIDVGSLWRAGRFVRGAKRWQIRIFLDRFLPSPVIYIHTQEPRRVWILSPAQPQEFMDGLVGLGYREESPNGE
jgi:hypothetical protein